MTTVFVPVLKHADDNESIIFTSKFDGIKNKNVCWTTPVHECATAEVAIMRARDALTQWGSTYSPDVYTPSCMTAIMY